MRTKSEIKDGGCPLVGEKYTRGVLVIFLIIITTLSYINLLGFYAKYLKTFHSDANGTIRLCCAVEALGFILFFLCLSLFLVALQAVLLSDNFLQK